MTTYLCHHGIKGQSWGVRNGPPYPLDKETHDKVESKSSVGQFLKDHKKEIITGTAIMAGLVIGGVYLAKHPELVQKGISSVRNIGIKSDSSFGSVTTADIDKMFEKNLSNSRIDNDFKGINPNFTQTEGRDINFVLKADDGEPLQSVNCQACSLAYEIRRKFGKDVQAHLIDTRKEDMLSDVFKNAKTKRVSVKEWSDLSKQISKFGNGSRGVLGMTTAKGKHMISFEVVNGRPILFDCQIGKAFDSGNSKVFDMFYEAFKDGIELTRLDNLGINSTDSLTKYIV